MQFLDPATRPAVTTTDDHDPLAWRAAALSLELILDVEKIGRDRRSHDLIDALLFTAVLTANVTPMLRNRDLELAYATIDTPAPPELRRPVSVSAIAHSLGMPFETVRRRVRGLVRNGALAHGERGVIATPASVVDPAYIGIMLDRHQRIGRFYADLLDAGVLAGPEAGAPRPVSDAPVRVTNRAFAEYMLRAIGDLVAFAGDVISALVLGGIARANTEGLKPEALAQWALEPAAHGTPIRTGLLAERLGISPETCRRYAVSLEAAGLCVRGPKGLVATASAESRRVLARIVQDNLSNIHRMFARLRQLGVLTPWDDARAAAA